jgi:hypothetical protein
MSNNTIITVTKGAILHSWGDPDINLWKIPLVNMVRNNNTDTIIVNPPPTEYLPEQPPPSKAIHNVYELKTQPKLVRYHHASAGFSTKPTWLEAIKNKRFALWLGLTLKAARKYFPDSDETHNGHGRKPQAAWVPPSPNQSHSLKTVTIHSVLIINTKPRCTQSRKRKPISSVYSTW